jgi:hypothetical protein
MEASAPRQQLLEQTVVELQEKLKSYEDRQDRFLNNINQAITELLEKAAKQRGVRGQDMLALHHFFATHLASALQQLEIVVDEKLKLAPHQSTSTAIVPVAVSTPELEARLALIESKVVQKAPVEQTFFLDLESKFQQLEANTVQELRRIHQTTFKPGDFGTPLNQLQQKVSNLESQVRSFTVVDSVKLAETTMSAAIRSFRTEFEETLKKYVSAEDLFVFKTEIGRLEELVIEAQTRSHTLLQKSSHIESYVANMLGSYKAAALRMEESIMLEYQKFDRNLESHYRQWCQKQFDVEAVSIRAKVLEDSKEYFTDITDKVARQQGHILERNMRLAEKQLGAEYTKAKDAIVELHTQLEKLDTETREKIQKQYDLTEMHIQHSRTIFSELTLSIQKTVQSLYDKYSKEETARLDTTLSQCIQKIVLQWDSIQKSIADHIQEKMITIEKLSTQAQTYVVNSEEIIKKHVQRFESFILAQTEFTEMLQKKSESLISSTADFIDFKKQQLQISYDKYAQDLTTTVDKKLREVSTWDARILLLSRQYHEEIEQLKKGFTQHMNDFEEYMTYTIREKAMTMETLEKMMVEEQSKFNQFITDQQSKYESKIKALEATFFNMFLETQTRVDKVESAATKRLQELQQYTPQLEVLLSNRLQDIQTQAQQIIDDNHKVLERDYLVHQQNVNEGMRIFREKMDHSIQDYLKEQNQELQTYNESIETRVASLQKTFHETVAKVKADTIAFRNEFTKKNEETMFAFGDKMSEVQQIIKLAVVQTQKETSAAVSTFEKEFEKYMQKLQADKEGLEEKMGYVSQIASAIAAIDPLSKQVSGLASKLTHFESLSYKLDAFQQKTVADSGITDQRVAKLEKIIEKQQDMILELLQKQSEVEKTLISKFSMPTKTFAKEEEVPSLSSRLPFTRFPMSGPTTTPKDQGADIAVEVQVPQTTFPIPSALPSIFTNKNVGSIYKSLTKCFFTAIFGTSGQKVDRLPSFVPIPGWDAVCFTNQDISTTIGWSVIRVDMPFANPSVSSKYYKWMSHLMLEDYDVVVWMDAYLAPDRTKVALLDHWITSMYTEKKVIGHRAHAERNCIYDECEAVLKYKRDTPANVDKVRSLLASASMPKNKGLFDTNIVIKFHKDAGLQTICKDIFQQLQTVSNRDQLAVTLQYHIHKFNQVALFPLMEAWQKRGEHVRIPAF